MEEEKREIKLDQAIKSNNLRVFKPDDFSYQNALGSGAFGKVRKCKIKRGLEGETLNTKATTIFGDQELVN